MGQSLPSDSARVPTNVCFAPIATVRRATHSEPRPHCGYAFLDQRHRVAYWTNNGLREGRITPSRMTQKSPTQEARRLRHGPYFYDLANSKPSNVNFSIASFIASTDVP